MDLKVLIRTHAKIVSQFVMLVFSIVTPLDFCQPRSVGENPGNEVGLLSEQNQRVTYKLASEEYLGCARDQPMPLPFPAPPIF